MSMLSNPGRMSAKTFGTSVLLSFAISVTLGLAGCGDDGGTGTDSGTGTDTPATDNTTTDAPMDRPCPLSAPDRDNMSGPCCSRVTNSMDAPEYRMSDVDIAAPSSLALGLIDNILNEALNDEYFNWLLRAEITGTDVALTTGFGRRSCYKTDDDLCEGDSTFTFDGAGGEFPPVSLTGTLAGETVMADRLEGTMILPIVQADDPTMIQLVLPLQNLELSMATMSEDRNCVGRRFATSYDTSMGAVSAYLTVEDAKGAELMIGTIMNNLCAFAAGISGMTDATCDNTDQATWGTKPDSICTAGSCTMGGCDEDTECNAWFVSANFAAQAVEIAE